MDTRPSYEALEGENSELKETVITLREKLDQVKAAIKAAGVGLWESDPKTGRFLSYNEVSALFAVENEQLIEDYQTLSESLHPDDRRAMDEAILNAVVNQDPFSHEFRFYMPDGSTRWFLSRGKLVFDESGTPTSSMGTIIDITERKQAEKALRESEERFRTLSESSPMGVFQTDGEGRVLYLNSKWLEITGMQLEKALGFGWSQALHPDDSPRVLRDWDVCLTEKTGYDGEFRFVKPNGEVTWTRTRTAPVFSPSGELLSHVGANEDITDHKRAEVEKQKLEDQLVQAQKMEAIGSLSGGIAHDFNNIIGIIVGNTELALREASKWDPTRENLIEIQNASIRARDMVKQILAFSRPTRHKMALVRISPIIEESLKLLRASIPSTVEIHQDTAGGTGTVDCDPTQINQVLMNLCTNAAHAMREKGGILQVRLKTAELDSESAKGYTDLVPGTYVELVVRDTGHGIKPELLGRIFDPYFTTKEVGEGSGIGLSVVHGIVKNHRGSIRVESRPGKGTAFHVLFPTLEDESESDELVDEAIPGGSEHILLVDDEPAIVKLYQTMLEHLGYTVTARTGGIEALEEFRSHPDRYDIVITDQTMPHLTGEMLAKETRAIVPGIPIILCTGHSDIMDSDKAEKMGISAFAMKPIAMRTLARTTRDVLDGTSD